MLSTSIVTTCPQPNTHLLFLFFAYPFLWKIIWLGMLSEFATNHEFSLQAIHLLGILFTLIQNFWNNSNVLKKLFSILVECKLQKKHKVYNNPIYSSWPRKNIADGTPCTQYVWCSYFRLEKCLLFWTSILRLGGKD